MKINNTNIKNISLPAAGQHFYWSSDLKGFGVRATKTGLTYIVQRRVAGRTVRHIVGKHPEITPMQAVKLASKALANLRAGIDLNTEKHRQVKQAQALSITLSQAYTDFKKSRKLRATTLKTYDENINRTLADWLDLPLTAIDWKMVEARHRDLSNKNGPRGKGEASANQTMRLLRVIFNYAGITYDDGSGSTLVAENPVKRLSLINAWNRIEPRDQIIEPHDMPAWYEAVLNLDNCVMRDYFLFTLFSGLRRTECMKLQWSYINPHTEVLTLPAEITKNKKKHQLPLSDFLLELLAKQIPLDNNPYIFHAAVGTNHISEPKRSIAIVSSASGVDWSMHTLRRTFASIGERLDISHYKLKQLLNHSVRGDVTGNHYIQIDIETLRAPMQRITDYILEQMPIGNKRVSHLTTAAKSQYSARYIEKPTLYNGTVSA